MEDESQTGPEIPDNGAPRAETVGRRSSTLPLTLTLVSLLLWFGFQTVQLVVERGNLLLLQGNLGGAMQEAQKVRAQIETLISKTAELANQGNASAKTVVEELEKRGIPIKSIPQTSK